jgi:hypothetical protein
MKVTLTGLDRLWIINSVIPKKGGRLEMQAAKELMDMISIKTSEFDEYGLFEKEGSVYWDEQKIKTPKDFSLTKPQLELLQKGLSILDKSENIELSMIDTYDMIMNCSDEEGCH